MRASGAGGAQYSLKRTASGLKTSASAAATKSRVIGPRFRACGSLAAARRAVAASPSARRDARGEPDRCGARGFRARRRARRSAPAADVRSIDRRDGCASDSARTPDPRRIARRMHRRAASPLRGTHGTSHSRKHSASAFGEDRRQLVAEVDADGRRASSGSAPALRHSRSHSARRGDQRLDSVGVRAARGSDDHRHARPSARRSASSSTRARSARGGAGGETAVGSVARPARPSRQHFARQRQVDRALRFGSSRPQRTIDHVVDLACVAQLVVPLHQFAHHAGLVEHLLRPVDARVARAERAGLRRSACGPRSPGAECGRARHSSARRSRSRCRR